MSTIWNDVKGRKIFKAATVYAAVSWGIIQIADILLPVLQFPDWIMSSMVLVAFSGFPLALILGWMLDIRQERKKLRELRAASGDELSNESVKIPLSSRLIELSIILVFGGSAAMLYLNSSVQQVKANIEPLASIEQLTASVADQKTIAVLPFENFGGKTEDAYFADGLSEELLNVLAKNRNLRVAARTSSFQYKNKRISIKTIAKELGVQYILEGSVRRSGDLIRVTAQLIKADEDVHIFSSTWDKNTENVFKVQDEIAQSVLDTLEVKLLGKTEVNSEGLGTHDIDAFAEYSRGVAYVRNRGAQDFKDAIINFNKAIELDPNYPQAYAMLAQTYLLQLSYGLIKREEAFELAKPNIEMAESLDPDLAEAHAVNGLFHWQQANAHEDEPHKGAELLEAAKFHLNKAIELNPSNAEAYMWYGSILQIQGKNEDGQKLHKKAFEIDPKAAIVGYNRAKDLIQIGDYAQAMDVFNTVVRANPNYANAYTIVGEINQKVGQLDQAYNMYRRVGELSPGNNEWLFDATKVLISANAFELANQNIERIESLADPMYQKGADQMRIMYWLATGDYQSVFDKVATYKEQTKNVGELIWRSYAEMANKNWNNAIQDLEVAMEIAAEENTKSYGEWGITVKLLLAKSYRMTGDRIKSDALLTDVDSDIKKLVEQKRFHPNNLRYFEATRAAIADQKERSLSLLRQAVQEGFTDFWAVDTDPSFDSVRGEPMFAEIRREYQARISIMRINIESSNQDFAAVD